MSRSRFVALVPVALLGATGQVGAEPLSRTQIQARAAAGEFRGYGSTPRYHLEDFILRLRPDGTVRSISQLRRRTSTNAGQFEEYGDAGTWRVEGSRLCVAFGASHRYLTGCYGVNGIGGDHVRLTGPVQLEGTLGN